jgi:hypothetical protein
LRPWPYPAAAVLEQPSLISSRPNVYLMHASHAVIKSEFKLIGLEFLTDDPIIKDFQHLDTWSIGIITLVSLSGNFRFEQGEDFKNQLSEFKCEFESKVWEAIS